MWLFVAAGVLAVLAMGAGGSSESSPDDGPPGGGRRRGGGPLPDLQLTPHFTLSELSSTGKSDLAQMNFEMAHEHVDSLTQLAQLLEQVRSLLGDHPISIHDAYRCPELNERDGGAKNSQHMLGEAADFDVEGVPLDRAFAILKSSGLKWGQLIYESEDGVHYTWIHISLPRSGGRNQMIGTFDGADYHWE